MSRIPFANLAIWHLDKHMRLRSIPEIKNLLPNLVAFELRQPNDPGAVVQPADNEYPDPNNNISAVPETDISAFRSASGRIPRHDDQVELDQDVENEYDVPNLECWLGQSQPIATVP